MSIAIISKEFTASMSKAMRKQAEEQQCGTDQIQIALELSPLNENVYKVCKNFALLKVVKLGDILFLNPIYSMFKGQVASKINECLSKLKKEQDGQPVTVFIMQGKINDQIRMMLYVKGAYKSELSAAQIISN